MEEEWANALKNNQSVKVDITPIYKSDGIRPDNFRIKQVIDGKTSFRTIRNEF